MGTLDVLKSSHLGKKASYKDLYDPSLLFAIERQPKRIEIGMCGDLPFCGYDLWTAFELSWLNEKGKPQVAVADLIIPCESKFLIESKSFKLYLNSFNNTKFKSINAVKGVLIKDISKATDSSVKVDLYNEEFFLNQKITSFDARCIDYLDISCQEYTVCESNLKTSKSKVENKAVYSNLLRSNCLVTGQPDWGSVLINYSGSEIDEEGLLKYIVSFRNHNEFHEQCVERIFNDILKHCRPKELEVYARYTRRGGLDINPFRSLVKKEAPINCRLFRQ